MTLKKKTMAVLLSLLPSPALAEDFFQMIDAEPSRTHEEGSSAIEFSGVLTHRFHYALTNPPDQTPFRREGTGPASIRYDVLLEARYRPSNDVTIQLAGLASYDAELEDSSYIEMDQSYIEWGVTPSFNIKSGRQILSLGESNYFQVADRTNPIDERSFGLSELRETLLPVAATRFSYYQSRWGVDLIAMHEFRPNLYDEPFGDFDPYIELRSSPLKILEDRPDVSFSKPDLVSRIFWSRPRGDLAVFASQLHSRHARPIEEGADTLSLSYSEITLLGASANRVLDGWLLKSEYAFSNGGLYLREHDEALQMPDSGASVEGRAHHLMVGGRYSGTRNLTLDFELLGSRIDSTDGPLGENRTEVKAVASIEYEMLNNDLVANLTYMGWEKERAAMVRGRFDYAFRDEIVLFAGAVNYRASSEGAMLAPYENNDRIFIGFTLSF